MTSTDVNIGIEGRSSSRVLKPPGGGHTNLFGEIDQNEKPVRKDHGRNASSILEGTNTTPEAPKNTSKPVPPQAAAQINEEPPAAQPSKARVPPGGFSSGLW